MALRQKYILGSSPSKLKRGNLGNIRSDRVFYKTSHEQKSRHDLARKDREDMYLLKKTYPNFIQYVSDPKEIHFETYLFSKMQIDVLEKIGNITIHVDATGTVVRQTTKSKRDEKRMLIYAAVISYKNRIHIYYTKNNINYELANGV